MSDEIKPSLSIKYILLVIITAIVSTSVGYFLNSYYSKENKIITVSSYASGNKIKKSDNNIIDIKYTLKSNPQDKILSYYTLTAFIKNNSDFYIEEFDIFISSKQKNIILVDNPIIKTIPRNIIDGINIKKYESTKNKHKWKVDLLNKNEAISFEYSLYSKEVIKDIDVEIVPRKKGWSIVYEEITNSNIISKYSIFENIVYSGIFMILLFTILIVFMYKIKWNNNKELQSKYSGDFWKYFREN